MGRFDNLQEIVRLDPVKDHCRIVYLTSGYEFPWDTIRALEIALYRTYCVPRMTALLDKTGEFRLRGQRRYDDTALIVAEIMKNGYDSERGREALRRMNRIHGRYDIENEDFLFVLSVFIYEPIRWYDSYGWRKTARNEKLAFYYFWREVGRRMNIKNIPASYEAFEEFHHDYQRRHFRYSDSNRAIATATRNVFLSWFPSLLAPLLKPGIYAMLDEAMLDACGFPHVPRALQIGVSAGLKARGLALRYFPARKKLGFITEKTNRTYPNGYKISDFGPPDMLESLNRPRESA